MESVIRTVWWRVLQCVDVVYCSELPWIAVGCDVAVSCIHHIRHRAVSSGQPARARDGDCCRCCCSVLQWVAVNCRELHCAVAVWCCSELQWGAVSCSELQWVAVSCRVAVSCTHYIRHKACLMRLLLKRALYSLKRALYSLKRALYSHHIRHRAVPSKKPCKCAWWRLLQCVVAVRCSVPVLQWCRVLQCEHTATQKPFPVRL